MSYPGLPLQNTIYRELEQQIFIYSVLRVESLRSRCQNGQALGKVLFLVCRQLPSDGALA